MIGSDNDSNGVQSNTIACAVDDMGEVAARVRQR
jgi:hypothetical protein